MKISRKITTISLALALALSVFLLACQPTQAVDQGQMMPDFKLKDVDGADFDSSSLKGKVAIVDFWATWCPPCRMEVPHFQALHEKYNDQGLEIIGISLDSEGAYNVKPFMKKNNVTYKMLIGDDQVTNAFGGIRAIPTTFVVDRNGKVVKEYVGYRGPEVFEEDIKSLL